MTVKEPRSGDEEGVGEPVVEPIRGTARDRAELPADVRAELWLQRFPWAPAMGVGVGAFLLGYVGLFAAVLAAPVGLPDGDLPIRVGFLYYNAHNVVVTGLSTALPSAITPTTNYLPLAEPQWLYRLYPAVVLAGASALFTAVRIPDRRSPGAALATGVGVGTGYVLLALVGTFAFSLQVENVLYQPSRVGTVVYVLGYGLLCGIGGSLCGQAAVDWNRSDEVIDR